MENKISITSSYFQPISGDIQSLIIEHISNRNNFGVLCVCPTGSNFLESDCFKSWLLKKNSLEGNE